jgi:hypothetical protein
VMTRLLPSRTVPFDWKRPYRWRTNLRWILPRPLCWLVSKGKNCELMGEKQDWYNIDDKSSGCYHCQEEREGQLWKYSK